MKEAYFIGIGGIGMSAIARYCLAKGYKVSGYDRTPSELTAELEKEGMAVHYEDNIACIPPDVANTLVVYTPAIPADLAELRYVFEKGYKVVKRSRMLGELSQGMRTLAVAGTHGKTTTSTLLAHIFQHSGTLCNAFLGGISKNYDSNLLMADNDIFVAEADEFDRSFLQLHPDIAVITAMDADHLDIYNDLAHVQEAFRAFASQVKDCLVCKLGLPLDSKCTGAKILHYSYDDNKADFYASDIVRGQDGCFSFTLNTPEGSITGMRCGIPGWVNVENSIAAAAAALCFGMDAEAIKAAIACYKGVKRRFDVHYNNGSTIYIDDYAHHPEELAKAISSIRGMFPGKKITAVFQPHLYTRTRDFAPDFARALSTADKVILLDIYPAREEPIEGVTSSIIFDKITLENKLLIRKEELMETLAKDLAGVPSGEHTEVLVTFGAGNIDRYVDAITKLLEEKLGDANA